MAEVHKWYPKIAENEENESLSHDHVFRLLKEQSLLRITETEHTGGGPDEGSCLEHRHVRDPEIVIEALDA